MTILFINTASESKAELNDTSYIEPNLAQTTVWGLFAKLYSQGLQNKSLNEMMMYYC